MNRGVALSHVRGLPGVAAALVIAWCAVVVVRDVALGVTVVVENPARGVGAVELVGAVLALSLPILSAPVSNGRERLAGRAPRWVHAVLTTGLAVLPALLLPVWSLALSVLTPSAVHPPVVDLSGNLVLLGVVASAAVLSCGRAAGTALALVLFGLFVVAQQMWPGAPWSTLFSRGDRWHTNWPLTIALCLGLLVLAYRRGSVPR